MRGVFVNGCFGVVGVFGVVTNKTGINKMKVFGFSVVGSFKGFDVISEV